MPQIYLIRHGEVEHNRLARYSNEDEPLNATGIKQAEELREKVKNIPYDAIYSSPLTRAMQTAEIINIGGKTIVPSESLAERNPGALNGHPLTDTNREEYWNYNTIINYGAEDIQSFFARVWKFIDQIKEQSTDCPIMIVAHSGVSKAFSAYFEGIGDGYFLHRGLKNCQVKLYQLPPK